MSASPLQSSSIVKKSLDIYLDKKKKRNYLKWGGINSLILSVLMYDIKNKCPFAYSKWYYIEYLIAGLFALSVLYYFTKFLFLWITFEPIRGTQAQRKLLHFEGGGNRSASNSLWGFNRSPTHQQSFNTSQNPNYSWSRVQNNLQNSFGNNTSPNQSNNNSFNSPYKTYTKDEIITDEHGLQKYLREVAKEEISSNGNANFSDLRETVDRDSTNTLWNYWNNAANLLKTSIYQLSPTTTSPSKQTSGKELVGSVGPGCSDLGAISDLFKTISSTKLTKYVTNLRMWISATILQRLAKEFDRIDNEFAIRGFSDIKIGGVGLERLKKTAENHMVSSYVPTLSMILPFLEISTNQEYLVQRIRED